MKEFKVNEYITLKLEKEKTNIYVSGELFNQCKFLFLNVLVEKTSTFDEIESIDEAAEKLDRTLEGNNMGISPETKFWGHCSNLQVWQETKYKTKLLNKNIAFPLLKKLAEMGDVQAKRVFKSEIAERFITGIESTKSYLIEEGYLDILEREEFWSIMPRESLHIKDIDKIISVMKLYTQEEEYLYSSEKKEQVGFALKNNKIDKLIFYECTNNLLDW